MALSEPHNFGQCVRKTEDGWIQKPRPLFWERLFLSPGFFRSSISNFFLNARHGDPFLAMAILRFQDPDLVECFPSQDVLALAPHEARDLGAAIAILAFFGILDLNMENVLFGRREGRFQLAPIDIECIGADLTHLAQSYIVPSANVPEFKCGMRSILPLLRQDREKLSAALIEGYWATIELALRSESALDKILAEAIGEERPPVRVLLRLTKSYANYMKGQAKPSEFLIPPLASELEQMGRGDIPYYFRYPDETTIRHFIAPGESVASDVNGHSLTAKDRYIPLRALCGAGGPQRRQSASELGLAGALQIARACFADGEGRSAFNTTFLECDGREIFLDRNGRKIRVSRKPN